MHYNLPLLLNIKKGKSLYHRKILIYRTILSTLVKQGPGELKLDLIISRGQIYKGFIFPDPPHRIYGWVFLLEGGDVANN